MGPEVGRQALQWAAWIVVVALVLLLFLDRGSAEFVITVAALVIGLVMGAAAIFLVKRFSR
ncbi:MAG TPA: hypothetical protein VD902_06230 [Symbiobacteriaceae bacterium]|nr:hypothetical protein [Symbiobacteriaceae bacterium]